jgi:hypothetical protein
MKILQVGKVYFYIGPHSKVMGVYYLVLKATKKEYTVLWDIGTIVETGIKSNTIVYSRKSNGN